MSTQYLVFVALCSAIVVGAICRLLLYFVPTVRVQIATEEVAAETERLACASSTPPPIKSSAQACTTDSRADDDQLVRDFQVEAEAPVLKEDVVNSKEDAVIPEEKDAVIPEEKDAVIPEEKDAVIPEEKDAVIPEEKDAVIPEEKDAVIPEEKDAVIPEEKDALNPADAVIPEVVVDSEDKFGPTESKENVEGGDKESGEGQTPAVEGKEEEADDAIVEDSTESQALKVAGNEAYNARDYKTALERYTAALEKTPTKDLSLAVVLLCNMSAVHLAENRYEESITAASDAIELDPNSAKARLRRYRGYVGAKKLHDALTDLKTALDLDPTLRNRYQAELAQVQKESEAQFEKEKDEMIGKVKELGNWALGKIGMSLDHFKVIQDPASGSYNIQYAPPENARAPCDESQ